MQKVKGKSESIQILNNYLEELRNQVNRFYNKSFDKEQLFTIDDFKQELKGGRGNVHTLIKVFEENNNIMKLEIGNKYVLSIYNQYVTTLDRETEFIKKQYKKSYIELSGEPHKKKNNYDRTKY